MAFLCTTDHILNNYAHMCNYSAGNRTHKGRHNARTKNKQNQQRRISCPSSTGLYRWKHLCMRWKTWTWYWRYQPPGCLRISFKIRRHMLLPIRWGCWTCTPPLRAWSPLSLKHRPLKINNSWNRENNGPVFTRSPNLRKRYEIQPKNHGNIDS